jgi:ribosomal protein S9
VFLAYEKNIKINSSKIKKINKILHMNEIEQNYLYITQINKVDICVEIYSKLH